MAVRSNVREHGEDGRLFGLHNEVLSHTSYMIFSFTFTQPSSIAYAFFRTFRSDLSNGYSGMQAGKALDSTRVFGYDMNLSTQRGPKLIG